MTPSAKEPWARLPGDSFPFLCLLYVFNILDRANVGFARLTMQDDLKMSQAVFDVGFGLFYIGYLLFRGSQQSAPSSGGSTPLDCPPS